MSLTIRELTGKYKNGSLTPLEFIKDQLNRLENVDRRINPIVKIFPKDSILKQAKESTQRYKDNNPLGPFDGISITIKDTSSSVTRGVELNKGSMILYLDKDNQFFAIPTESVKEVQMLQDSGAIILCLTTVPEMCYKGTTSSLLYGITRNPHNITITPGGSSGGAAALTALNIGCINIGTDGAGSIRIPASCCGVMGYKPSYSIGHSQNNGARFPYLSHCGPITRYIDDIIIYIQNIQKYTNNYNLNTFNIDLSDSFIKNKNGISGMNIAVSKTLDGIIDYVDNNVWKNVLKTVKYLELLGANITFIDPALSETKVDYYKCVGKLWSVCFREYAEFVNTFNNGNYKHMVDPGLMDIINRSNNVNVNDLIEIFSVRDECKQIMNKFHSKYDLLITPTLPVLPPQALSYCEDAYTKNMKSGKIQHQIDCYHSKLIYTSLCNFTHQPAISMPAGYIDTQNGKIPIGVQIIGAVDKDNIVLKAAYCLENKFKYLPAKL